MVKKILIVGGGIGGLAAALACAREGAEMNANPSPAISTVITADIQLQISRHIRDYPQAVSGRGGHALTLKLACDLGRGFGLPDHVVLKILERWNTRNTPPWSPKDLERFLISARKRPDIQEGYLIRAPLDSALVEEVL